MILESIRIALASLRNNKLRSFLTLLGIVIGVYAVVTLLSAAQGVQRQITEQVEDFGPTSIAVLPGEQTEQGFNIAAQFAPSTLFLDDVDLIEQKADLVDSNSLSYFIFVGGTMRADNQPAAGDFVVGTDPEALKFLPENLRAGRFLSADDLTNRSRVIVVNNATSTRLDIVVGERVTIGADEFEVIGITEPANQTIFDQTGGMLLIPGTVAAEINRSSQVARIVARAIDPDQVEQASAQIEQVLKEKRNGVVDFSVRLPSDLLESFNQITDILTYLVVGIASISLLVGGIGISNIMLVTVTERTKEIGIRKAVGATEGAILTQFLIESVVLTTFGALIGIGLAYATGLIAAAYSPLEPVLTVETILLAIGMGVLTGIFFGLFPAFRAARKHPVEALRYE